MTADVFLSWLADIGWEATVWAGASVALIIVITALWLRWRRMLTLPETEAMLRRAERPNDRRRVTPRECFKYLGYGGLTGLGSYALHRTWTWLTTLRPSTLAILVGGVGVALAAAVLSRRARPTTLGVQAPDPEDEGLLGDDLDGENDRWVREKGSWTLEDRALENRTLLKEDSPVDSRPCRCGRWVGRRDLVCQACGRVPYTLEYSLVIAGGLATITLLICLLDN